MLLNLGTGRGHSVREVIDVCRRISGREIPRASVAASARRSGRIGGRCSRERVRVLDWQPQYPKLEQIVENGLALAQHASARFRASIMIVAQWHFFLDGPLAVTKCAARSGGRVQGNLGTRSRRRFMPADFSF